MRRAMAEAEVGDDVYGEDPTVNRLEQRAAEIFGKEAALFVPTGTMGNQIAVRLHTQHGQEVICERRAHIVDWEMAMVSAFSGCQLRQVEGERGVLRWERIAAAIAAPIYYRAQTGLIALENTHNMAGGTVTPLAVLEEVWAGASGARAAGAPGWSAGLQRGCGAWDAGGDTDARLCHGDVLPEQGAVRAGGLDAGRLARADGARPVDPQDAGRGHAAGGRAGCGGPDCAGRDAGAACTKTTPTRGGWPSRLPGWAAA